MIMFLLLILLEQGTQWYYFVPWLKSIEKVYENGFAVGLARVRHKMVLLCALVQVHRLMCMIKFLMLTLLERGTKWYDFVP